MDGCNCRDNPENCPLDGHCKTKDVVYKADLKFNEVNPNAHRAENVHKTYVGSTSTTFKKRWDNHKQTFNREDKSHQSTLATEIWRLKNINPNYNYDLKWSIATLARSYRAEQRKCQLCLAEKTKTGSEVVKLLIEGMKSIDTVLFMKSVDWDP